MDSSIIRNLAIKQKMDSPMKIISTLVLTLLLSSTVVDTLHSNEKLNVSLEESTYAEENWCLPVCN